MTNPSLHPPPHQPPGGGNRRTLVVVLVTVVAVLAAVLALIVAVALITSSDDQAEAEGPALGPYAIDQDSATGDPADATCVSSGSNQIAAARWTRDMTAGPEYTVVLTAQFPLPASFSSLADPELTTQGGQATFTQARTWFGVTQYQDGSIGVINNIDGDDVAELAVLDPTTGQVVGQYSARDAAGAPTPFDLAKKMTPSAYYSVVAADGVEIPGVAAGTTDGMNYALGITPDAFEDTRIWVLMRGSQDVYKAELHKTAGTSAADYTVCGA